MVSVFDIAESRPTKNKKQGEQVKQQDIKTGSKRTDKKIGGHLHE
jgi:hypothetical protein